MSLKNSNDTIGNRTRDLPVCSVVQVSKYVISTGYLMVVQLMGLWLEEGHLNWPNKLFWGENTWDKTV